MLHKIQPTLNQIDDDVLLANELKRLALLSPHLLADVGLAPANTTKSSLNCSGDHQNKTVVAEVRDGKTIVRVASFQIQHWSQNDQI